MSFLRFKQWLGLTANKAEDEAGGETAVATPPSGADSAAFGDDERETSTNAQTEGAAGEPWPGND